MYVFRSGKGFTSPIKVAVEILVVRAKEVGAWADEVPERETKRVELSTPTVTRAIRRRRAVRT